MYLMNLEEVKKEIIKINDYLKNCLWMDFELSHMNGGKIILSGSIDMSQDDYAIDIYFEYPYYVSSLLFWHTDTKKKFVELVETKEMFDIITKYKVEAGNYIFKIYPENYDDSSFYIIAKKIACKIINKNPFDFMDEK